MFVLLFWAESYLVKVQSDTPGEPDVGKQPDVKSVIIWLEELQMCWQ